MKRPLTALTKPALSACLCFLCLSGALAEDKTKLFEPYAPKPSGPSPAGWEIQMLKGSSIESKTTLRNGREIKVNAPAYELVPSAGAVVMVEPGFDPSLGNAQKLTVGALITQYSEAAADMQKNLEKTLGDMARGLSGEPKSAQNKPAPTPQKPEAKPEKKKTETPKPR